MTPHDLNVEKDFLFFGGTTAAGNGDEQEANYTYVLPSINVTIDVDLTQKLMRSMAANATMLSSPSDEAHLIWGSVVPILFLPSSSSLRFVFVSLPGRRLVNNAVDMVPELLRVGQSFLQVLESSSSSRVGLLISGDLSHRHLCDGPYGCDPSADKFDNAVAKWFQNTAGSIDPFVKLAKDALSCGFSGLVIMSSVFKLLPMQLAYMSGPFHPSYYGMIAATFNRV